MKKIAIFALFSLLIGLSANGAFAGGDKVRGELGEGTISQEQLYCQSIVPEFECIIE